MYCFAFCCTYNSLRHAYPTPRLQSQRRCDMQTIQLRWVPMAASLVSHCQTWLALSRQHVGRPGRKTGCRIRTRTNLNTRLTPSRPLPRQLITHKHYSFITFSWDTGKKCVLIHSVVAFYWARLAVWLKNWWRPLLHDAVIAHSHGSSPFAWGLSRGCRPLTGPLPMHEIGRAHV